MGRKKKTLIGYNNSNDPDHWIGYQEVDPEKVIIPLGIFKKGVSGMTKVKITVEEI